jgi:GT2 family glycosyltransferase
MSEPAITLGIPNFNRSQQLHDTLSRIALLNEMPLQIVVVDNGSTDGADDMVQRHFPKVELIRLQTNLASASRNLALRRARAPITLMLDNDSYPQPGTLTRILQQFRNDRHLGILACLPKLLDGRHESGGLPGVFVGCGAAMRTELTLSVGGYPENYGYYVEEYDLSFRIWQTGHRVRWDRHATVIHAKSPSQRNRQRIFYFLTRNNLHLWSRYAPRTLRRALLWETVVRYGRIARRERAMTGYLRGLAEGLGRVVANRRHRRELAIDEFDAIFGLTAFRHRLAELVRDRVGRVTLFGWGKGVEQIVREVRQAGLILDALVADRAVPMQKFMGVKVIDASPLPMSTTTVIVGTLSPGVATDWAAQAKSLWPTAQVVRPVEFE